MADTVNRFLRNPTFNLTRQKRDPAAADRDRQETVRRLKNQRAGRNPDDNGVEYAIGNPTENAMTLVYKAGLPKETVHLVRRLLALETENLLLKADIGSLSARLFKLENKA